MNLLVMSLSKAEHINTEWESNPPLNFSTAILFVCGIFALIIGLICLSICLSFINKKIRVVSMCVIALGVILLFFSANIIRTEGTQTGAVQNVKDFYKMKHLKKIYPKLPCRPKYKICASKSLTKASRGRYAAMHTLTKHKAILEYNDIKANYRKGSTSGNGSKSLTPRAPRFSDYL